MKKDFQVIITKDLDGIFVADVPELPGCHTQAKDLDSLMIRVREAIELYLEVHKDRVLTSFVGIENVSLV